MSAPLHRFAGRVALALAAATFIIVCTTAWAQMTRHIGEPLPINAEWTKRAWAHYTKREYLDVIRFANRVIDTFGAQAHGEQKLLTEKIKKGKAEAPVVGNVTENQKANIHKNGLLNDVATCYFLKGKSYLARGSKKDATTALQQCVQLTLGRCWDPRTNYFWSPAEEAQRELARINNKQ